MAYDRLKASWNDSADGWRRWEPHFTASTWPVTQRMIGMLRLEPGATVLDVGCGVGDPCLAIAAQLGEGGSVVALDPSEGMIGVARERAKALGMGNVTFHAGPADELAGYSDHFDAISARWSVLFFKDMKAGLGHLRSMLRVGGRLAVAVWTPREGNPMFAISAKALGQVMTIPKPSRDEPNPLRLSEDGELVGAMAKAGFEDVVEEKVRMLWYAGDAEEYWRFLNDVSVPFRMAMKKLDTASQKLVKDSVLQSVSEWERDGMVRVPAVARVAVGRRGDVAG